MTDIQLVTSPLATLGENPLWDVDEERLYWIDVEGRIYRSTAYGQEIRVWALSERPSSLALRSGGGAIMTWGRSINLFDFETNASELVFDTETGPMTRMNDGKVDRNGRFITGLSDSRLINPALKNFVDVIEPAGYLIGIDADLSTHKLAKSFGLTNGPCFSPDGATFYCSDSWDRRIYAFDYDTFSGELSNRRILVAFEQGEAVPDGATVDEEGFIWIAANFVGEVRRYAPDGTLDRSVHLPVAKPTSVAFGGSEMDILFVTTMGKTALPGDAMPGGPLGGSVLAIRGLGVQGIPELRFAG